MLYYRNNVTTAIPVLFNSNPYPCLLQNKQFFLYIDIDMYIDAAFKRKGNWEYLSTLTRKLLQKHFLARVETHSLTSVCVCVSSKFLQSPPGELTAIILSCWLGPRLFPTGGWFTDCEAAWALVRIWPMGVSPEPWTCTLKSPLSAQRHVPYRTAQHCTALHGTARHCTLEQPSFSHCLKWPGFASLPCSHGARFPIALCWASEGTLL